MSLSVLAGKTDANPSPVMLKIGRVSGVLLKQIIFT